jgi:peroxiredoxin
MSPDVPLALAPPNRRQNVLKGAFVMGFSTFASAAAGIAIWRIIATGPVSPWWGVLGVALSFVGFLSYLFVAKAARTSRNLPGMLVLAVVSWLATGALAWAAGTSAGVVPIALSSVLLVGVFLYIFWYSRLPAPRSTTLSVGSPLPNFVLEDSDGHPVSSQGFAGKPTVFLFFRGNWCPLCVAQIREIAAQYRELSNRGAEVALISPQPHTNTRALAKRFDAPMRFLVDPHAQAARQLGIVHEAGLPMGMQALGYDSDTVLPTVIITDASQRILWLSQTDNYRVRPEPETFLNLLDAALPAN